MLECLLKILSSLYIIWISYFQQQEKGIPTDEKLKFVMQEALQLRLSLVGGMFDTIQRNSNLTVEWCILLAQLVSHSVDDFSNNR